MSNVNMGIEGGTKLPFLAGKENGMGLFDIFRGNQQNSSISNNGTDMEHLTPEGTLPYGWIYRNKEFTDKINAEYTHFLNNWTNTLLLSPLEQYGTLKSFVIYMNEARNLCHSKGECFANWFDTVVAPPEYIRERTEELEALEANFHQLQDAHEERARNLVGLEARMMDELRQHDGILQSEFLKLFDPSVKNDVSEYLYIWAKDGKIERVKSGRSYTLHIK